MYVHYYLNYVNYYSVSGGALSGRTLTRHGASVTIRGASEAIRYGNVHVSGTTLCDCTFAGNSTSIAIRSAGGASSSAVCVLGGALTRSALSSHGTRIAIRRTN